MKKYVYVLLSSLLFSFTSFAVLFDISKWDSDMWTNQLLFCIRKRDVGGCRHALSNGAQINKKDSRKRTPLMWAIHYKCTDVVRFLLANKAKVNLKDDMKRTALHRASSAGHQATVSLLLRYKADPNLLDKKRETPLDKVVFCSKNKALLSLLWTEENVKSLSKKWSRIAKRVDNTMFKCLIEHSLPFTIEDLNHFSDDHKRIVVNHSTGVMTEVNHHLYTVLADLVRQYLVPSEQWKLARSLENELSS